MLNTQLQILNHFLLASYLSPSSLSLLLYHLLGSFFRPSQFEIFKPFLSLPLSWDTQTSLWASQSAVSTCLFYFVGTLAGSYVKRIHAFPPVSQAEVWEPQPPSHTQSWPSKASPVLIAILSFQEKPAGAYRCEWYYLNGDSSLAPKIFLLTVLWELVYSIWLPLKGFSSKDIYANGLFG